MSSSSDESLRCCLELEARDEEALHLLPPKSSFTFPLSNHPLSLSNTSFLTSTSLDMCTESLGCETGTIDHLPAPPRGLITTPSKPKRIATAAACFPPPLTSIGGVQVQTHREAGRLVIKAYAFSSAFQAERRNGRLRLSLVSHEEIDGGGGGYIVNEDGGKVCSSSSRCNGERRKKLQSLQFCVVGV